MLTYYDYWRLVEDNFPNYSSSDLIAWEQDEYLAAIEETDPSKKKEHIAEMKRLNHLIMQVVVDDIIDKHFAKV